LKHLKKNSTQLTQRGHHRTCDIVSNIPETG